MKTSFLIFLILTASEASRAASSNLISKINAELYRELESTLSRRFDSYRSIATYDAKVTLQISEQTEELTGVTYPHRLLDETLGPPYDRLVIGFKSEKTSLTFRFLDLPYAQFRVGLGGSCEHDFEAKVPDDLLAIANGEPIKSAHLDLPKFQCGGKSIKISLTLQKRESFSLLEFDALLARSGTYLQYKTIQNLVAGATNVEQNSNSTRYDLPELRTRVTINQLLDGETQVKCTYEVTAQRKIYVYKNSPQAWDEIAGWTEMNQAAPLSLVQCL